MAMMIYHYRLHNSQLYEKHNLGKFVFLHAKISTLADMKRIIGVVVRLTSRKRHEMNKSYCQLKEKRKIGKSLKPLYNL